MNPAPDARSPVIPWRAVSLVLLLGAGLFFGGATEPRTAALMVCALGVLGILFPVRQKVPGILLCGTVLLLLLALAAFLPLPSLAGELWRAKAVTLGVPINSLVTPQADLVLAQLPLLVAGLFFLLWAHSQGWNAEERRWFLTLYVAVLTAIAILAFLFSTAQHQVPFWKTDGFFGPFPNRNHTANMFCLGAILAAACAEDRWQEKRRTAMLLLLVAAVILAAATVRSYSRAGVILLFVGLASWILGLRFIPRRRSSLGMVSALVVVGFALFFVVGGATAGRFLGIQDTGNAFRFELYRDAFSMTSDAPLLGFGLGNFPGVFPQYRVASVNVQSILHPESDWLLAATELGWVAVAVLLFMIFAATFQVAPFQRGTAARLRVGALAACVIFLAHSFVDVPAHRLGTVLPLLALLGIARHPSSQLPGRLVVTAFRLAGVAVLAGGVWLYLRPQPIEAMELAVQKEKTPEIILRATAAIAESPMDWRPYFTRAAAAQAQKANLVALADYRRARFLEPTLVKVPLTEADGWRGPAARLGYEAWREAVRRAKGEDRPQILRAMLERVPPDSATAEIAWSLAEEEPRSVAALMKSRDPKLHRKAMDWLMERQSNIDPSLREALFKELADQFAGLQQYAQATRLALKVIQAPEPPEILDGSETTLRDRLEKDPGDFAAGYALIRRLQQGNRNDEAGALAAGLARETGAPAYLKVLAAKYRLEKGAPQEAWDLLRGAW